MDAFSRPLRVFLCHSSDDKPIVRELYRRLDAEGWIDVWLDEEKLLPGQDWDYEIEQALDNSDAVIVTLSTGSVSKEGYVQRELRFVLDIALEKPEGAIYILPVRLDDCARPRRLRSIQGIDYFPPEDSERAYTRLRRSLELRARHLDLLSNKLEDAPSTTSVSPILSTPTVLEPSNTNQLVGPRSTSWIASLGAFTKRHPIWKYGRIAVLFLLITGFFGPWYKLWWPTGAEAYYDFISMRWFIEWFVIIPIVVGALFLVTLVRLFPWKFTSSRSTIIFERLTTASGAIVIALVMIFLYAWWNILDWGLWFSVLGVYLAPINILFESVSSRQKGQKLPRWVWALLISIILPWLLLLLLYLWGTLS